MQRYKKLSLLTFAFALSTALSGAPALAQTTSNDGAYLGSTADNNRDDKDYGWLGLLGLAGLFGLKRRDRNELRTTAGRASTVG